jgi:hypothetical protein
MPLTTKASAAYAVTSLTIRTLWIIVVTNSMQQGPSSEANSRSSSQEIPRLAWNPKVCYRGNKDLPLVAVHRVTNYCNIGCKVVPELLSS